MAQFGYRTFLLPRLFIRLGVMSGVHPADPDFLGNQFMLGAVSPENVNQLLSTVHPITVFLNLAGYQLEGIVLAAKTADRSAAVYVNPTKAEYCTEIAFADEPINALQKFLDLDFPVGDDVCMGLRLTPRPRWWHTALPEEYYALPVSLDAMGTEQQLNAIAPPWFLLGGTATLRSEATFQEILTPLETTTKVLLNAIASALALEWDTKSPLQRRGLLSYLNPANWGDSIIGANDPLRSQYQLIVDTAQVVYDWLESLDQQTFADWLLDSQIGSFKETLHQARDTRVDKTTRGRYSLTNFENAIKSVFLRTQAQRDWMKFDQLWDEISQLKSSQVYPFYVEVLMFLEELAVIDLLGRVRQTSSTLKEILPFDISGFYEQAPPANVSEDDPDTYDFHTLQINQAGIYAQGFWQERVKGACSDPVNGGRYLRFKHYRLCLEPLGNQSYDPAQTAFGMQLYRWTNSNLLTIAPYLKLPNEADAESLCNHTGSEIGTLLISRTAPLSIDTLIPSEDRYFIQNPSYGVEIEVELNGKTLLFRRVSTVPYLAQVDLIELPTSGREDLVLVQRFPLHSLDKVRILAGASYLIDSIQKNSDFFASDDIIDFLQDPALQAKLEEIDRTFAEWLARYVCHTPSLGSTSRGPQFRQIQKIIVNMLAKTVVWDDKSLEILTTLTVFLANYPGEMPYTRAILGDALPAITPEMQIAVRNSTAGFHVYRWSTNGLGEEGQSAAWPVILKLIFKGAERIRTVIETLDDLDSLIKGLSIDINIFLLDIEKLSPLTDPDNLPYPGWAADEKQTYLGFQVGGGLGVSTGVYLNADSSQVMYSSVNWDPGDFSGPIHTYGASCGLVLPNSSLLPFLRIDMNNWLENLLRQSTPIELLGQFVGFDPQNLKLGFGLSVTFFLGNTFDGELRWPIRSGPSFNWIDYSTGIAAILEANAMYGAIIRLPDFLTGKQTTPVLAEIEAPPVIAVEWRVIEYNVPFQTFSEINEWVLTNEIKTAIRTMVAEYLACFRNRNTKLTITGHASPIGTEQYNLWLSQKRAQAVYDYIRSILPDDEYAILPHNTTVQGYGELYATHVALLPQEALAPEWQTVMVYLNGQLITRIGEQIRESD